MCIVLLCIVWTDQLCLFYGVVDMYFWHDALKKIKLLYRPTDVSVVQALACEIVYHHNSGLVEMYKICIENRLKKLEKIIKRYKKAIKGTKILAEIKIMHQGREQTWKTDTRNKDMRLSWVSFG